MDGDIGADRRQAVEGACRADRRSLHRRARSILLACLLQVAASPGGAQQAADRIYVRRIEFRGVERTNDEVLRRELRQIEGAFLNPAALEESRIHLERLPSVESVTIAVTPVVGSDNVVDVVVTITEEPTRRYSVGGGYASSLGTSLHGYFANDNLFGSGQQFSVAAVGGELGAFVDASHTNPLAFDSGVSRTISLMSRDFDQLTSDASSIDAKLAEARLEYGYPIGARQSVALGLALRETSLGAGSDASVQLKSWIGANGEPLATNGGSSTELGELDLLFRWRHDTRNRESFPERGLAQSIAARAALPASEVEYFTIQYEATHYWSVGRRWTASVHGVAGYGDALGETTGLPPYLNWFAGGPSTVRGYRGLGPNDSLGNPYGGNLLVATQLELKTAWPRRWAERLRSGVFLDVGNVYSTDGTDFYDAAGQLVDYGFDSSQLRASAGIAADLLLPFGTVRLSYAVPLNPSDGNADAAFRDDTERFQISFGVDF